MRSEPTRPSLSRSLAVGVILMASGLACSTALAAPKAQKQAKPAQQGRQISVTQLKGKPIHSVTVDDASAISSTGTVIDASGIEVPYVFNNQVIVQSTDWDAVAGAVAAIPGARLGDELGTSGSFRVVDAPNVGAAFDVQRALKGVAGVITVEVDSGATTNPKMSISLNNNATREQLIRDSQAIAQRSSRFGHLQQAIGVLPYDGQDPASIPASQWHFINDGSVSPLGQDWTAHDNNILESIFSTDLLTGAGVRVGIGWPQRNMHLDIDHGELLNPGRVGGYVHSFSQIVDLNLNGDESTLTGYAGLFVAERDNPVTVNDLQGVAPEASLGVFFRGPSGIDESRGLEWMKSTMAVKVHDLTFEYDTPQANYNRFYPDHFVAETFENSLRFGRNKKGTIHIFGTGATNHIGFAGPAPANLMADPYAFPPAVGDVFSPWDVFAAPYSNQTATGVTNGFILPGGPPFTSTTRPFYVGGQTANFPLANNRNSIIINSVSEDGNRDSFSAIGPGVFASVYAGSSNAFWSGDPAISGRGVATIIAGGGLGLIPDVGTDLNKANTTGASIAGGIVALMLDANPNLTVRDVQHIFFESIQESTKPASVKWPNYPTNPNFPRSYYFPGLGSTGTATFWQNNAGFYNNPTPPVTVPPTPPVLNQTIRHSDEYGFGVIDANLAIQKAKTWPGTPRLILLDSGLIGDVNSVIDDGSADPDAFEGLELADATFSEVMPEPDGATGTPGFSNLIPTGGQPQSPGTFGAQEIVFCIRDNIKIESIVVELTIEGEGSNDLYITLTSPSDTRSILLLPTTRNVTGQSTDSLNDDEIDRFFGSGGQNGTAYAYYQHPFLTHKHWGELSGGTWAIGFADFGPDMENPEGVEPAGVDPGADAVVNLGEIGVPGSTIRTAKTVTAYRIRVYGTDVGADPFLGCRPFDTFCPADLNGDGVVGVLDLQIFIHWYQTGDVRADVNSDGQLDFGDIQTYVGIFEPGFCTNGSTPPFSNGRPVPGPNNAGDNFPQTRPF